CASARRAGRAGGRAVAVLVERDAEAVARPVGPCGHDTAARGDRGVPGVLDALAADRGDAHDPAVRGAHGVGDVEAVVPLLGARDGHGAASAAASTAAASTAARAAGGGAVDRRQGRVAVRVQRHAEVVAVAVRCRGERAARARDVRVPAVLQALARAEPQGRGPLVRARDRDVDVEAVAPRVAAGHGRGAAVRAAATTAATATTATTATAPTAGALAHGDVGGAGGLVPLGRHDLVVVAAEVHPRACPRVEVLRDRDRARGALLLAHAPVLVVGRGAHVCPLGDALRAVDMAGADAGRNGAEDLARGSVSAPALHDVVP